MSGSCGRLFVPPLASLEGQGRGSLGGGSSSAGVPPLSQEPISMPSYAPMSTKGVALEEVTHALISKGAVELAPLPSLDFYSRLFLVWKTSRSWRPVIDLFHLNRFLASSPFKMETIQSVLRLGDWMVSIDLKEAYLQIPVHPDSRKYLRCVAGVWLSVSIQGSLFRPRLGPPGFHMGYGSCFVNLAFHEYSSSSLSR